MDTPRFLRGAAALAIVSAGLLACTHQPPAPPWQKAGSTPSTVNNDTVQCQIAAQQQVSRLYPYGSSNPTLGGAGMVAAQQQANIDRDGAQLQIFNECMANKGYQRSEPEPAAEDP